MNNNDREFLVQKIRTQYTEKQNSQLDMLRELDKKVKRPANIIAYITGAFATIALGIGMSLFMTDIGKILGMTNAMIPGIVVGAAGILAAIVNYPIYQNILGARKKKYADKIIQLSDEIMKGQDE